jgi:hypothetical protein
VRERERESGGERERERERKEQQDLFVAPDLFSERELYFKQRTIFGAVSLAEILRGKKKKQTGK